MTAGGVVVTAGEVVVIAGEVVVMACGEAFTASSAPSLAVASATITAFMLLVFIVSAFAPCMAVKDTATENAVNTAILIILFFIIYIYLLNLICYGLASYINLIL